MRPFPGIISAIVILAVGCGGEGTTPVVTPLAPVVTTVTITPATSTLEVGATLALTVDVRNQLGAAMTGQVASWVSGAPTVATVSDAGTVTAVSAGTSTITATVGGRSATSTVTVVPVPVASATLSPLVGTLNAGQSVLLVLTLRDRNGVTVTGRQTSWASDAPTVATVDAAGRVTGVTVGTAVITALTEGVSGSITVAVGAPGTQALPTITGVLPATLAGGAVATLTGTGFDSVLTNNEVTVRGVTARLVSASPTSITLIVPCMVSGAAVVQVRTNTVAGPVSTQSVATARREIAPGQAMVISESIGCSELPSGPAARYLISVFSIGTGQNTTSDFELEGNPSPAASPLVVPAAATARGTNAPTADALRDRAHFQQLERNREIQIEARAIQRTRPALSRTPAASAPVPVVGDRRDFYYSYGTGCRDTTAKMFGRAIHVGTRGVIWEDTANTLRAADEPALASYYERLGRMFDEDHYEVVRKNFGDPLRRDAVTDNDGRIHMVFSQKVNGSGAAAFVTSCDQYPTTFFAASNFGQLFYGMVPTIRTSNLGSTASPDGWFTFMGRTVVHELKHIASVSARVANGVPPEESWLEEGTARHAEELWVREHMHAVPWKGNTGYGTAGSNGLYCDFHPESAACNALDPLRRPGYGMRRHFNELREKLLQPWNWSLFGDATGQTGSVFYQTSWSLVRYVVDRHATSEPAFFTALTNASSSGLASLASISEVPSERLLGLWGLALVADDYPGLASPSADIQFATWNLRNIYAGLNADPSWASRFTTTFPLVPVPLPFGSFTTQRTGLRAGAQALYELSGTPTAAQVLNIRSLSGGNPPSNIRLAIARLQ